MLKRKEGGREGGLRMDEFEVTKYERSGDGVLYGLEGGGGVYH